MELPPHPISYQLTRKKCRPVPGENIPRNISAVVKLILIIIIKGHSLQPATNTQNSKPRPPTTNAKMQRKTTK